MLCLMFRPYAVPAPPSPRIPEARTESAATMPGHRASLDDWEKDWHGKAAVGGHYREIWGDKLCGQRIADQKLLAPPPLRRMGGCF